MLDQNQYLGLNEKYRKLAQKTNLNGLLRAVFSPILSLEECNSLIDKAKLVRQEIKNIQTGLIETVAKNEIIKITTLRLIRDSRAATATPYLRWRNYKDGSHGDKGFYTMLYTLPKNEVLYSLLLQLEEERIGLNMQIGVIHCIIKQLEKMSANMARLKKYSP